MSVKTDEKIVEFKNVTLKFSPNSGVFDLNYDVAPGLIFGLIGPSGCGKTTTVRLMAGLYKPTSGNLSVLGQTPTSFDMRTRERIGYMPQQFILYPYLTVMENLQFVASLYGVNYFWHRRKLRRVLEFVELYEARHRLASKLSGGMQRRLLLACALVHDPALLFADEPTAGVDPVLRGKFWEFFRELRNQKRTLFVTTQYVGEAAYCDLVGVMRNGRLIYLDTPESLRRKALGGEIIELVVPPNSPFETMDILRQQPVVKDVHRIHSHPGRLHIYVDNAAETMPVIINVLSAYPHIHIQRIQEYLPPFDDIFIQLMEKSEEADSGEHI
ncbi:MAG: ABC transporter ATP-binding protein [Chloroflexi bacterium]|nr:ABC transporter ATP-binding protein [Chloroflexota bacterium]